MLSWRENLQSLIRNEPTNFDPPDIVGHVSLVHASEIVPYIKFMRLKKSTAKIKALTWCPLRLMKINTDGTRRPAIVWCKNEHPFGLGREHNKIPQRGESGFPVRKPKRYSLDTRLLWTAIQSSRFSLAGRRTAVRRSTPEWSVASALLCKLYLIVPCGNRFFGRNVWKQDILCSALHSYFCEGLTFSVVSVSWNTLEVPLVELLFPRGFEKTQTFLPEFTDNCSSTSTPEGPQGSLLTGASSALETQIAFKKSETLKEQCCYPSALHRSS